MDIVDAQVHLNKVGIGDGLTAMDALGVSAALIDEYEGTDEQHRLRPFHLLPNGAGRPVATVAEAASRRHPTRLSYLLRVDYRDPDLEEVVRLTRASPYARALRICIAGPEADQAFERGECNHVFEIAQKYGFPLFVQAQNGGHVIETYIRAFPDLRIIVDHCGVANTPERFDRLLGLAQYSNTALKWAHAPFIFSSPSYPFPELDAVLRRLVDAFGADRIMWASDFTEIRLGYSWADTLYQVRNTPVLTEDERAWILGGTVRRLLDWPAVPPAPHR